MATSGLLVNELDKDLLLSRVQQLIFVDGVAGFECQRCDRTLVRHYVADCGHKFCANCKRVLTQSKSNCPLAHCKKDIGDMDFQDVEFERKLYELRAHCPNKSYGCPFVSQLKDLGGHLRVCKDTRDNALPVLIEGNNVVEAILRELSVKFDKLSEEMVKMKVETSRTLKDIDIKVDKKLIQIKYEIKNMKMETDKTLAEVIKKLDGKANETQVETKLNSMKLEIEMLKINNQKENVFEIDRKMRKMTKETEDQNSKLTQQIQFLEQEIEKITTNIKENKSNNSSNFEEKVFTLENFILLRNPQQMSCFSLAVDKDNNFQPDLTWKIKGIRNKLKETFEIKSPEFQWRGYPVFAQAKMEVDQNDFALLSLCFDDRNKIQAIAAKPHPMVYYVLKDQSGKKQDLQHKIFAQNQLYTKDFNSSLNYYETEFYVPWFSQPLHNVDDSIVFEVYVETPTMAQQVHSYDGTLNWVIDNYNKKKQMDNDLIVLYQDSPYFYTAPKGYRVQASLWLNGFGEFRGKGLSVEINFLTGKFDDDLPKTFPHRMTITLFNRKDPQRNIIKTVDKVIGKHEDYLIDVCLKEEIENVIMNDALVYNVTIKPSK